MPRLCGCTGDSTTCIRRWTWSKKASAGRRSTTIGESVDDSELAKSPSIAKPEMDESFTARTSGQVETPKSIRPPVTFDLDGQPRCRLESLATQPSTDAYVAMRNHSLDIEVGSISPRYMEANCDANRTFPNFFNSKPTRASTRLYPTHTAVVIRRGSQLVRAGRPLPLSSLTSQQSVESSKIVSSTTPSATVPSPSVNESHSGKEKFLDETFIVTPFAQILAGLRSVQTNIGWLTDHQTSKSGSEHGAFWKTGDKDTPSPVSAENYDLLAAATKKELEWCLQQLENIQTKRPVSDMAYTKFKRLLSQKLGNFTSTDKTRNQISEYISKTFMDEYSEQENNDGGSSNALAGGSEGMSTSRTDVTGFSLESSVDEADSRTSRRHSRPDRQASASLTTTKSSSITDPTSSVTTPNTTVCESKSGQLPYLGITTSNDEAVRKELEESLDTWGLNMFSLDTLSDQHSLTVVAYRIFSNRELFSSFNIDPATFVTYILRLESSYQISNPYHNHIHGADVLQAVHVLLQAETLDGVFSDIEILTTLFASAIHDVHHPGVTNQFLVNTGHKLALLYNDASVLENHHLSVAFKLLTEPGCDIFANLAPKQRQFLRRLAIELVLATDMSKHMNLLAELRTMVETKELTGTGFLSLDDHNDRSLVLQCMLHCADLSTPTKPFEIYKQWTFRVMEEFFKQGDKEKELGIEVSAMCDRDSVVVDKTQIGFIDFVIHPLWDTWCDLVHPSGEHILEALDANRDIIINESPFKEFENRAKKSASNSSLENTKDNEE